MDPTPLVDVSAERLARFALEDDGRERALTTNGIRWHRRDYIAAWMVGHTGMRVVVRRLPHHDDVLEVFDTSGEYLGSAYLAEAAGVEEIRALKAARAAAARRLRADLKAAERLRRERYKAQTVAGGVERRRTPARGEAEEELAGRAQRDRRQLARPGLIAHRPAPEHWVRPVDPSQQGNGGCDEN